MTYSKVARMAVFMVLLVLSGTDWQTRADEEPEKVALQSYLFDVGDRLDCYFTIEKVLLQEKEVLQPVDAFGPLSNLDIIERKKPENTDELIKMLRSQLKGVTVVRNREQKQVIHLIEERVQKIDNYVMNRKVTLKYKGPIGELKGPLSKLEPRIGVPIMFPIVANIIFSGDYDTPSEIDVKDCQIRDLLTKAVPIKGYMRIIWEATTEKRDKDWRTEYMFWGTKAQWDEFSDKKKPE